MGTPVKEHVRQFYESVGWRQIGEGLYQNARYEDLRPVSAEYLRRCHLRVARFLPAEGRFLLDAGSGPIQYPEYLEYSKGYAFRVCLDISQLALTEARARLGRKGLYVVGDVAQLPFVDGCFGGLVSLHTVHHLPPDEHQLAFREFHRTLQPAGRAAVVYSWGSRSGLMRLAGPAIWIASRLLRMYSRLRSTSQNPPDGTDDAPRGSVDKGAAQSTAVLDGSNGGAAVDPAGADALIRQPGTFTFRHGYRWVRRTLDDLPELEIRVWRSISTQFLRTLIHAPLQGRRLLRVLYWMEERFPHFFGRYGQYPLILFRKPGRPGT